MKLKKAIAALLALCLLLAGVGAAAEQEEKPDVIDDLLRYFLKIDEFAPEEDAAEATPAEAAEDVGDYVEGAEEYVVDEEEEEIVVQTPVEVKDLSVTEGLSEDWLNILLLGTDSRGSSKYLRTDTMIILSVNQSAKAARMTSIMRDTWVEIPGHGGQKLNAACVYGGPELTVKMINEYFGLNIRDYALVNMKCLVEIVDSLGGIQLDVSPAEARAMNKLIESDRNSGDANASFATASVGAGEQLLLNGKQVLAYSRIRKLDSDYARTERQRAVLVTIAKRMQKENLLSLAGIVTSMLQYVETNLSFDEIMTIAGVCMKLDLGNLTQFRVPADGTYESGMFGGTWCIKPDFEANAKLLKAFIYGE